MKIKLLHDARVEHKAGEVVDTSPECAYILLGNGMACPVEAEVKKDEPKKETKKSKK